MVSSSLRPRPASRAPILVALISLSAASGCFRGADLSKIVCSDSKYCPSGYTCVIEAQKIEGRCEKLGDGGGGEAAATFDGATAMDGAFAIDGARGSDVGVSLDGAIDQSAGAIDQASGGNVDSSDAALDTGAVDLASPDAQADSPQASPDAPVVDVGGVADVAAEVAAVDAAGLAGGAKCQSDGQCASTFCVDGVCCDGACTGQCQACAEPNKVGACTTVSGAPRGTRTACAATSATCAGLCGGLPNQCSYPGSGTLCSAASCSGDLSVNTASVCNGAGACTASIVVPCGSGKYCTGGSCVAQVANGGSCADSDQCASGNCTNTLCCAAGQTGCGTTCVSLSSSNANCGTCARSCAGGSTCSGGSCYLVDGQSCTTGTQCLTGVCSTFYVDGDGDGYGTTAAVQQCGTTVPTGYANKSGDCCDSDANAHPGQTAYFTTADACGSFDYNCDGQETKQLNGPAPGTCGGPPTCAVVSGVCTYVSGCTCGGSNPCSTFNPGPCGGSYTVNAVGCTFYMGVCEELDNGGPYGTQACN
jgi:hypothetical protein